LSDMRLLLIEDNIADAALIRAMANEAGGIADITHVRRLAEAFDYLSRQRCDLVLLDLGLPDSQGLETLERLLEHHDHLPVVVLTGLDDEKTALAAIRDGAQDYLPKERMEPHLLVRAVHYAKERHALRRALQQALDKARLASHVMESTLEGIFITDREFCIIETNPAFSDISGLTLADVRGEMPVALGAGHYEEERYLEIRNTVTHSGFWQGEVWNRRKSGEVYTAWLTVSSLRDDQGRTTGFVGLFTDITQRKLLEEHLKKMAHYDVLTGLPNRALFGDRLAQALRQARRGQYRLAVLFIDLDRFKPVNDTLGHDAGDDVLREVAERIRTCVRDSDTVARIGGDEFAVILDRIGHNGDAAHIADAILQAMAAPFTAKDVECAIGASIGVSFYPEHGEHGDLLLAAADRAMYEAKKQGGNKANMHQG